MFSKCPRCGLISRINEPNEVGPNIFLYCENCDDSYNFEELSVFVRQIVAEQINSQIPNSLAEISGYLKLKNLNEQKIYAKPIN